MVFLSLFQYRKSDWFIQERRVEISLVGYNKHMLIYAVKNSTCEDELEPGYLYSFAEHARWVDWAQNIRERYKINGQRNVYLNKTQKMKI